VPRPWRDLAEFAGVLAERGNDLTAAAVSLASVVGQVLEALGRTGARHAAMSGSGATCFALYDSPELAQRAASALPTAWWRHVGKFV